MKKDYCTSIFFFVFLLFTVFGFGQTETSFPMDYARWAYIQEDFFNEFPPSWFTIEMEGDSVINGITYNKIDNGNWGLTRNEAEKVYYIPPDSTNEILLYDFSLEVGDTFFIDNNWIQGHPEYFIIEFIDSVETQVGYLKRWNVGESVVIDGMGSIYGLFVQPAYLNNSTQTTYPGLFCFQKDSVSIIEDEFVWEGNGKIYNYSCEGVLVNTTEQEKIELIEKVFPNPFIDEIFIKTRSNYSVELLELFDLNSQLILSKQNSNSLFFDSKLPNGVYFLRIWINGKYYLEYLIK